RSTTYPSPDNTKWERGVVPRDGPSRPCATTVFRPLGALRMTCGATTHPQKLSPSHTKGRGTVVDGYKSTQTPMAHSTPSSNFEPQFSNMPTPGHAAAESLRRRPKIGTVKNILAFSKAL